MAKGFLEKDGHGRWASYNLSKSLFPRVRKPLTGDSSHMGQTPPIMTIDSSHKADGSTHEEEGPLPEANSVLLAIAQPAERKNDCHRR